MSKQKGVIFDRPVGAARVRWLRFFLRAAVKVKHDGTRYYVFFSHPADPRCCAGFRGRHNARRLRRVIH